MKLGLSLAAITFASASFFVLSPGPAAPVAVLAAEQAATAIYYPPAGSWAKKSAADLGMDQAALDAAVEFAKTHETRREMDFSDQERIFGTLLGSVPNLRAHTNGGRVMVHEFSLPDNKLLSRTYQWYPQYSAEAWATAGAKSSGRVRVSSSVRFGISVRLAADGTDGRSRSCQHFLSSADRRNCHVVYLGNKPSHLR